MAAPPAPRGLHLGEDALAGLGLVYPREEVAVRGVDDVDALDARAAEALVEALLVKELRGSGERVALPLQAEDLHAL